MSQAPSYKQTFQSPDFYTSTSEDSEGVAVAIEAAQTAANKAGEAALETLSRPNKYLVQVFDLGDENYKLNQPILVTIEEYLGEGNYVAGFPEVELIGEGVTESEALLNLKLAILDLYDELIEIPEKEFGKLPKMWLRVMKKLIIRADS